MLLTVGSSIRDNENNTYILDDVIGGGGFGTVYRAHRESDGFIVAVKTLTSSFESKDSLLSFQKEMIQAKLISSDHVIKYFYTHDGNTFPEFPPYIIMEYADGGTLAALMLRQKTTGNLLDMSFVLDAYMQLSNGMKEISNFLVHRDIKPENILIKDGKLKISDFGLSKLSSETTRTLTFKGYGTAKYVAPEAWNNDKNTIQMDIYSMGIVFYELATLQYPYQITDGATMMEYRNAHLFNTAENPSRINKNLSPSMASVIIRMLEKPTQKRFSDWDTIIGALQTEPLPEDDFSKIVKAAVNNRNQADITLQENAAKREEERQRKEEHCHLIRSDYERVILDPIRKFVEQFNVQYAGNARFDLKEEHISFPGASCFDSMINTPSGDRITISSEVLFEEDYQEYTQRGRLAYRTTYPVPMCKNRRILAWSQVKDTSGRGFNLLLLETNNSLFGDWYILRNTNSALGSSRRIEPFGFTLKELPSEIRYLNAVHIYNMDIFEYHSTELLTFLAEHV